MGILFKARGSNSVGLFFIRLALGLYTLILGIQQASNVESYINKVKALNMIDPNVSFIIGFILPFVLILFGALYIIGFFTPVTSFVLAITILAKIAARGLFPSDGIPFNKDIIFLACFLTTLFAGAGMLSFDALLDRKKKKVVVVPDENPKVAAPVTVEKPVIHQPNLNKPIAGEPIPPPSEKMP